MNATIILSGINSATSAADVTAEGLLMMKFSMLIFPLICILVGYVVYKYKFKIDSDMYSKIMKDLESRGDIAKQI